MHRELQTAALDKCCKMEEKEEFVLEFNYFIPTRILFGKGKLSVLHEQFLPGKKALIVLSAGTSSKKFGSLARLEEQLNLAGVAHALFDRATANPELGEVTEAARLIKEEGCDFLVGLGGGSSIDCAKAAAVLAANGGNYWDYATGAKPVLNAPLPVVAIPTTAGTGTEADPWMVVTNTEKNQKVGFGYEKTFPVLSIVDPDLMMTVPPHLTAYQGFDALFHSAEGYVNRTANALSDLFALRSIELIGRSLAKAVRDGSDEEARGDVALANTLAGMVESTSGCTAEHGMEHALSGLHPKLPHGAGLIAISKAYFTHLAQSRACDERMTEMARALGRKNASGPTDFVRALGDLQSACGVDSLRLSDYGVRREEFPEAVRLAKQVAADLFKVDPVRFSEEDILKVFEASYS